MELAGAQINANERNGAERRVSGLLLGFQRLSPRENAQPRPPGARAHLPAGPSPLPALGQPRLRPREGVGQDGTDLRGGQKSPQQLVEGMPSSGGGGQRVQCGGRPEPHVSLPAHPPQGHTAPPPQPLAPQAPARGLRSGEGHLWWFAWRGGEREKPKAGLAEGLTGSSTTLA